MGPRGAIGERGWLCGMSTSWSPWISIILLSPHTNRRTDEYGGSPEKRLTLLKRLVKEIREVCPRPYCLSVKLNSADYMAAGVGLSTDEGLEQVKWLVECRDVDFVEISGGNAENKSSKLHSKS